jgi:hypothetical protein
VRIIKLWGKEGQLFSSGYGYVYDLISTEEMPTTFQNKFQGVVAKGCSDALSIKEEIEEWKNRK